ncbi:whn transcription factor-like protein, partial [Dinothrombium tinctorium]
MVDWKEIEFENELFIDKNGAYTCVSPTKEFNEFIEIEALHDKNIDPFLSDASTLYLHLNECNQTSQSSQVNVLQESLLNNNIVNEEMMQLSPIISKEFAYDLLSNNFEILADFCSPKSLNYTVNQFEERSGQSLDKHGALSENVSTTEETKIKALSEESEEKENQNEVFVLKIFGVENQRYFQILQRAENKIHEYKEFELLYTPLNNVYRKPPFTYIALIYFALKLSKNHCLSVADIYDFICVCFPYFLTAKRNWKNSIRHSLSISKYFEKTEWHRTAKKGFVWTFVKENLTNLEIILKKQCLTDLTQLHHCASCA